MDQYEDGIVECDKPCDAGKRRASDPRRRRTDKGLFKAIPFAAIISAASLAWYISVSWVNFRDSVFDSIHNIELRLVAVEEFRAIDEKNHAAIFDGLYRLTNDLSVHAERARSLSDQRDDALDARLRVIEQAAARLAAERGVAP